MLKIVRREDVPPAEDYGFFGPDSVTWKVWRYPTSLTVGFQRAVVIEELDPDLVTSVYDAGGIWDRPRTRYDRTLRYFALVAFGDSRTTAKAADVLVKVHSKGVGVEPLSGKPYDANDPQSQLWIHLTAWHSILYAYEKYGPGKLSAQEEARYWRECAIAAELQTCDPADVPATREGIRAYFERTRPRLVGSELAVRTMKHLLNSEIMMPPAPRFLRPFLSWIPAYFLRKATLATLPQWMRELAGIRQSRLTDLLIRPYMRVVFAAVHRNARLELALLARLSPSTVSVVAPVLLGVPPQHSRVLTPTEARERYGYDKPAEAHPTLRAKQRGRALDGLRPSDEGIVESEPVLGLTQL